MNRDPFDINGVDYEKVTATSEMNDVAADMVSHISDGIDQIGASLPTYLIAQTNSAVPELRKWAARTIPYGIEVMTFDQLVADLWDVFGDDRSIAGTAQIRAFCRKAYKETVGRTPSPDALDLATEMLNLTIGSDDDLVENLASDMSAAKSIRVPASLSIRYEEMLEPHRLIDPRRAASLLSAKISSNDIPAFCIVAEDPSENDLCQSRFYATCASCLDVHVIRRDATSVPLDQTVQGADARFAVSYGWHVLPQLLADTIGKLHDNGADYDDIAVAVPDAAMASRQLFDVLASKGIPFECRYRVPCAHTAIGSWIVNIAKLAYPSMLSDENREQVLDRALDYTVASPYSHVNVKDIPQAKMELARAFKLADNNETTKTSDTASFNMSPEFSKIIEIVADPDRPTMLALIDYVTNEGNPYPEGRRRDDKHAAQTVVQYLNEMGAIGEQPNLDDLCGLLVTQIRSFGDADRVQIVPSVLASYEDEKHFIAYGMDMKSHSGYSAPGPFGKFLERMGCEPDPWLSTRPLRLQIMDMIGKSKGGGSVTFMRSANDASGAELPPSPVYSEVSRAWGGIGDDGMPEGLPPEKKASLSESQWRSVVEGTSTCSFTSESGGVYQGSPMRDFIPAGKGGSPHRFSPTDLELYWQCPRKWFVGRNGAGYSSDTEPDLDDPRIKGLIVHGTLMGYYRSYGNDNPRSDPDRDHECSDAIAAALDAAVAEHAPWTVESKAASDMFALDTLKRKVAEMVSRDVDFLPGFEPKHFEKFFSATIAGVEIGGTVDRIDMRELDDGTMQAVIVDYKGSPDAEYSWKPPKGDDPDEPGLHVQGLVYAEMLKAAWPMVDVVGIVYRGYNNGTDVGISFLPFNDKDKPLDEGRYRECMDAFPGILTGILSGIMDGEYPMRPRGGKPAACSFCNVGRSCPARR